MLIKRTFSSIFSMGAIAFLAYTARAQQTDSTGISGISTSSIDSLKKESPKKAHQFRLNADISKPITTLIFPQKKNYELVIDYYLQKELYGVIEAGFGSGAYEYDDLQFRSNNRFLKIGIDKGLFPRFLPGDWDVVFIGVRLCGSLVHRSEAYYTVNSTLYGNSSGIIAARNYGVAWGEITAGVRMEWWKRFGGGWNISGKFLMNKSTFSELPPYYLSGYGRAEKGTVFDFNVYLTYAFRW